MDLISPSPGVHGTLRRLARNPGAADQLWEAVHRLGAVHPEVWEAEPDGTLIAWQRVLWMRPGMLGSVLKRPPPTGLNTVSPSGCGIWDVVAEPSTTGTVLAHASLKEVRRLLAKVPLSVHSGTGLLWAFRPAPWLNQLGNATGWDPRPWLGGSASVQQEGACNALVDMVALDNRNARLNGVFLCALNLWEVWRRHPGALSPHTAALLRTMVKVIQADPVLRNWPAMADLVVSTPPEISEDPGPWWEAVERGQADAPSFLCKDARARQELLQALMSEARLHRLSRTLAEGSPVRSARRL